MIQQGSLLKPSLLEKCEICLYHLKEGYIDNLVLDT